MKAPASIAACQSGLFSSGNIMDLGTNDLLVTVENGIGIVTMNRPERRNALSNEMTLLMPSVLQELARNPAVGCVVLTGAGGAFCAGGDIKNMASVASNLTLESGYDRLRADMEIGAWLHEMPKPTIAMVRGAAAGAGFSFALACDIRIVSEKSKLTAAFANVAFSGDHGASYFLTQIVGSARAREILLFPEIMDGRRAFELGLVSQVVPDEKLEETAMALARRAADGPQVAYRYMKRNLNAAETQPLRQILDLEAYHMTRCRFTDDHKIAIAAYANNMSPKFVGR
jgi:2-(1,2-epoxy-1,2-dihydrophenyl)acetyl-CoA isomerase